MDIQTLKLDLVEKILKTNKPSLLIKINNLISTENDDWWDDIPPEVQESILEGMEDIKSGKVFSHENIINEAKQKYGF
ncbi:hypothetical protein GM418_23855 [Maribellus comscasis]|uniref:Addiction module protein n=1 Tax=Maribellus comscasis TaxID=2681766 RepID=A0A6I6K4R1_9BACT|nr:hypothetical protein [Maribellus comscasis]QGY46583.1 hypothetical protein GM418_23855 [Maribellus comscasis]